jgi:hypothetical protein
MVPLSIETFDIYTDFIDELNNIGMIICFWSQ